MNTKQRDIEEIKIAIDNEEYPVPECRECGDDMQLRGESYICNHCGWTITVEKYQEDEVYNYLNREPEEGE